MMTLTFHTRHFSVSSSKLRVKFGFGYISPLGGKKLIVTNKSAQNLVKFICLSETIAQFTYCDVFSSSTAVAAAK